MGRAPRFFTVEDQPLVPVLRATESEIHVAAIKPAAVSATWVDAQPQIVNRWVETLVADVSTLQDNSKPTPGFSLGDATLAYSFVKIDRTVCVRLYFALATNTRINTLTKDAGSYARTGDRGSTRLLLPYRLAAGTPYQFGLYTRSYTGITALGALVHQSQTVYNNLLIAQSGTNELQLFGNTGDWDILPGGPLTYDAAAPNAFYWTTGDIYNLQYEYETDEV